MNLRLELRWLIGDKPAVELPLDLIKLLDGVARGGNLQFAVQACNLSYRHAWGLVKHWEQTLGCRLMALEQGRGAELTKAGQLLREVWAKTAERTEVALIDAAAFASRQLESLTEVPHSESLIIAASHGFGVSVLSERLRAAKITTETHFLGSAESLKRYADDECDVAGFHLPQGAHGKTLWARFQRYLDARRDVLVLVETRELGFMALASSAPIDVADLASANLRFVNRQAGSGSRLIFDLLLNEAKVKPGAINGYFNEEYTHVAVAAVVAGGAADVGFGARAAAAQFNLAFWPKVKERYLLVMRREALRRKPGSTLIRTLTSPAYKRQFAAIPGSDSRGSGKLIDLKHIAQLIRVPVSR